MKEKSYRSLTNSDAQSRWLAGTGNLGLTSRRDNVRFIYIGRRPVVNFNISRTLAGTVQKQAKILSALAGGTVVKIP